MEERKSFLEKYASRNKTKNKISSNNTRVVIRYLKSTYTKLKDLILKNLQISITIFCFFVVACMFISMNLRINDLQEQINSNSEEVNSQIDDTNSKIEEANSNIDDVNSNLEDANTRIEDTDLNIDNTNINLDETNSRVDELDNKLDN